MFNSIETKSFIERINKLLDERNYQEVSVAFDYQGEFYKNKSLLDSCLYDKYFVDNLVAHKAIEYTHIWKENWGIDNIVKYGSVPLIKYFIENKRTEFNYTTRALDLASSLGLRDVVEYLANNGSIGCTSYALDLSAVKGDIEMVKWLKQHTKVTHSEFMETFIKNKDIRKILSISPEGSTEAPDGSPRGSPDESIP